MFEAAYTFSKAMESSVGQDVQLAKNERSVAGLDRTHVLGFNYVYQLPFFKTHAGALGKLLGGWEVSGITTFQSGAPFTVTETGDRAGVGGGTQRPDLVRPVTPDQEHRSVV